MNYELEDDQFYDDADIIHHMMLCSCEDIEGVEENIAESIGRILGVFIEQEYESTWIDLEFFIKSDDIKWGRVISKDDIDLSGVGGWSLGNNWIEDLAFVIEKNEYIVIVKYDTESMIFGFVNGFLCKLDDDKIRKFVFENCKDEKLLKKINSKLFMYALYVYLKG